MRDSGPSPRSAGEATGEAIGEAIPEAGGEAVRRATGCSHRNRAASRQSGLPFFRWSRFGASCPSVERGAEIRQKIQKASLEAGDGAGETIDRASLQQGAEPRNWSPSIFRFGYMDARIGRAPLGGEG